MMFELKYAQFMSLWHFHRHSSGLKSETAMISSPTDKLWIYAHTGHDLAGCDANKQLNLNRLGTYAFSAKSPA